MMNDDCWILGLFLLYDFFFNLMATRLNELRELGTNEMQRVSKEGQRWNEPKRRERKIEKKRTMGSEGGLERFLLLELRGYAVGRGIYFYKYDKDVTHERIKS